MEKKNPIDEAKRYLQNAKDLLKDKALKDGDYYTDSKYVRMAGDTAWKGCLLALDAMFDVKKSKPKGRRVDIDDYKTVVSKRDKKLLSCTVEGYNILHLFMGYDGTKDYMVCKSGMEKAEYIIDWCEQKYKPATAAS